MLHNFGRNYSVKWQLLLQEQSGIILNSEIVKRNGWICALCYFASALIILYASCAQA